MSESSGITQKCAKGCEGFGVELLSSGSSISARIMSAKLE